MQQLFPESFESLSHLVTVELAEKDRLDTWLLENGYQGIVDRVRKAKDPAQYATAVLQALDRRGLINADFFVKLAELDDERYRGDMTRIAADMGASIGEVQQLEVKADSDPPGRIRRGPPSFRIPTENVFSLVDEPDAAGAADLGSEDEVVLEAIIDSAASAMRADFRRHEMQAVLDASRSVVQLTDARGIGVASGVVISAGVMVVPDYVADLYGDADGQVAEIRIETEQGPIRSPIEQVLVVDPALRLGLCAIRSDIAPPIEVSLSMHIRGERLSIVHFPLGGTLRIGPAQAVVTSSTDNEILFSANTQPGSAGAALLDAAGRLVGINYARSGEISSAVTTAVIDDLLRAQGGGATTSNSGWAVAVDPATESVFSSDLADSDHKAVLVELTGPTAELPELDGVIVSSKWGSTVTAMVTQSGFNLLRDTNDVMSIEASRASGELELFQSVALIQARPQDVGNEDGDQAIIAVIDNGVDVLHRAFRKPDGTTKILAYWDQAAPVSPAQGASPTSQELADQIPLPYGRLYLAADIDAIISGAASDLPDSQECTHGTAVASISAGAVCAGDGQAPFPGGVSPASPLVIVRYEPGGIDPGYVDGHSTALTFIESMAKQHDLPVVVNISNGTNAGAHDGFSELELACTEFSSKPGRVVVKSAGNERMLGRHRRVPASTAVEEFIFEVADEEGPDHIELWWPASVDCEVNIVRPDGISHGVIKRGPAAKLDENIPGGLISALLRPRRTRGDESRAQLRIDLIPNAGRRVPVGEWTISVTSTNTVDDRMIRAWIDSPSRSTKFVPADLDGTVTIPGTAFAVITVGASETIEPLKILRISSAGDTDLPEMKPDLVAPGHGIRAALGGSESQAEPLGRDGTSFAAPHVAGAVALALSRARKAGVDPLPSLREIKFALRDCTPEKYAVWESRRGYGPLNTPAFLAMLDQTIADR